MNKQETLSAIEDARDAHVKQMQKIESLLEGKELEDPTPVAKTKCEFGQWLYGDVQHVKKVLGVQFYENLDVLHEAWHIEYSKIYDIFFAQSKKGFFNNFFANKKPEILQIEKAKLYYKELQKTTQDLLRALEVCERRITALGESKFH